MLKEHKRIEQPSQVSTYFRLEKSALLVTACTGIFYNIGLAFGPYFEGQLSQCLYEVICGKKTALDMTGLALIYFAVILFIQGMRCVKRFSVRRFANNTSRNMRHMLYNSLVHKKRKDLGINSVGDAMTKAVLDVDVCVEGMRKFTTEVFDTGIALAAYLVMLFFFDWRIACISCIFTPVAYLIAERLKVLITKYSLEYKKSTGRLNDATLDRISHAVTYRVFGQEANRNEAYEGVLSSFEKKAIKSNVWENMMQPVYNMISMTGAIFIIYFGAKNVLGTGWTNWNIAAFTAFLSCFAKMAVKSSKAAKLFNSVQKARVSWKRIKPFLEEYREESDEKVTHDYRKDDMQLSEVAFSYGNNRIFEHMNFNSVPGMIIGITGPIGSGKSAFGQLFLGEDGYSGDIRIGDRELRTFSEQERSRAIAYLGHQPELMSDSIRENIMLGEEGSSLSYLKMVCLDEEVADMKEGEETYIGNGGVCLSGGQQMRVALARTLRQDSHILVLDDPFSALDRKTERQVLLNLKQYASDKIVLLISHRLSFFPEFDKVIWINGEESCVSNHQELFEKNTAYRKLYELQTTETVVEDQTGGEADEH